MASSDYNYDDTNSHFPFFMLTMVGLVVVPLTYNVLKPGTDLENTATRIQSDYKPKDEEIIQAQRRTQKKKERKTKRIAAVVFGYLFMAYMIYLIVTTQRITPRIWDPYDILGVSRSASDKDINRFYKRLSLKYHPDKAKPDAAKNETLESINDRWVEMTKAYKALTDEEIKNNYLLYGNPDGKQSTSIGIAIPKWLVEENARPFVILFYAGLLGVFLPYAVGKWWYGTQALTKDRVLHATAGNLFKEWKEDMSEGGVLAALSNGDEFKELLKGTRGDSGAAKLESKVLSSGVLPQEDQERLKSIADPLQRKVLALLWAYVGRIDLGDEELERQKYEVAPVARLLNQSLSSITLPFLIVKPLLSSYHTSQNLIQAIPSNAAPVLQLPHFTSQVAKQISGSKSSSPLTVQKLMSLPPQVRRTLCSSLSDSQYDQAMSVASQIPHFQVAKAFFKVVGERVVTPGSLVQLVVKGRIIPPGTPASSIPPIVSTDLQDVDPEEGDIDALHGRKRRKTIDGSGKPLEEIKDNSVQPPLAFSPYYAADHAPRWHIFLTEEKVGRIAVPPFTFTAFDRPIFTSDGKPTFNMLTLRCQFQAPPQVHAFPFTMHMVCDSYVGFDEKVEVVLDVRDVSEAQAEVEEDEISEPDEGMHYRELLEKSTNKTTDSLAGQLQAMKTGVPPPAKKSRKSAAIEEDSDDESDTEGEVDTDSETNTDTDEE